MIRNILFLITILLILPNCSISQTITGQGGESTPTPTVTPLPTPVTVFESTISVDGEIVLPLPPQKFSFQATGLIDEVYVKKGDTVRENDPIAKIDDTDLRHALDQAEANLTLTEAQIANEEAPALPEDIREAQKSLEAAQAELERLKSLPSEEAITQAAADMRLREVEVREAQEDYDQVAYAEGIGMSPQAARLQEATLNYERTKAAYEEAVKPPDTAQILSAELSVVSAESKLKKLRDGLRPEAKAINEAKLREASLQVEDAREKLAKAVLYAPWDGLITEINAARGVPASSASITLVQTEPLRFATSNFSERNLDDIQVGDEATIFLKTYPDVPIPAVVYQVEFQSDEKDGDTALFIVYLDFNAGEFAVRPGMTGRVEISIDTQS